MGRKYQRRNKGRSQKQKAALKAVNAARREKPDGETENQGAATPSLRVENSCTTACQCKKEAAAAKKEYWNAYRRNYRMEQRSKKREEALALANRQIAELEGDLLRVNNQIQDLEETSSVVIQDLQRRVDSLAEAQSNLRAQNWDLEKGLQRETSVKEVLRKHVEEKKRLYLRMGKRIRLVQLKRLGGGKYRREAREVGRYLVSVGVDEKKVGAAMAKVAALLRSGVQ